MLDRILNNRILRHSLYWLSILIIYPIYAKGFGASLKDSLIIKAGFLPGQILATYLLIYIQIPLLLYRRKYLLFSLSFILGVYIFSVIAHLADDYLISPFLENVTEKAHPLIEILTNPIIAYYQIAAFLIPFITAAIKMVMDSFEEKQILEELEKEKADAELQFLKAQIHPTFLFSTLDHLYKLSKEQSDLAPEVVVKLSEMLDYMLYQGQATRVTLEKEIHLLEHYLELETLRFGDTFKYEFGKNIEVARVEIVPLILLSVLELILKNHPTSEEIQRELIISLNANSQQIQFNLSLSEKLNIYAEGLEKLEKQLILSYPNKHTFEVINNEGKTGIDLILYF